MHSKRKLIELKYKTAWYIGAILSFLLYFSGIMTLFVYVRRKYLKHHITIVLMYHRIGNDNNTPDMTVSTKNFERQIAYLKKNYDVISMDGLINRHKYNYPAEKDTATITFDDGFKDNYTNAYPILIKFNVPATIFVITGSIGKNNKMLNSEEIKIMQKDNIAFSAHTVSHKILSEIDKECALQEIRNSKSSLEEILHEKVKYFAYPKGKRRDFTNENMQMVRESGYIAAFSTENGCIDGKSSIFALNRIGIRNYPLFVFKVRVSGIFESRCLHLLRRYANLT